MVRASCWICAGGLFLAGCGPTTAPPAQIPGRPATVTRSFEPHAPDVTVEDIVWATDLHFVKLDLQGQGKIYGLQLVVVDTKGKTIKTASGMRDAMGFDLTKPFPVTIVYRRDGDRLVTKVRTPRGGVDATVPFPFGDVMSCNDTPQRSGDYYYLAADSTVHSFEASHFPANSTRLALKLQTQPDPRDLPRTTD